MIQSIINTHLTWIEMPLKNGPSIFRILHASILAVV